MDAISCVRFTLRGVLAALLLTTSLACAQSSKTNQRDAEAAIEKRDASSNGITVGPPKIYDDSLLQKMLNDAQAKLASLQVLDQSGVVNRLGSVTGATLRTSTLGINIQGSPTPQTVTTRGGPTGSTVTTNTTGATSTSTVQTTAGLPTQAVTTTVPQTNVPSANAPAATTSLPSSYSVSASDVLNEEMQLTYEIANLRLLLEGSLTDRVIEGTTIIKPRVTIGFPITISPQKRYRSAVAVVEVEAAPDEKKKLSTTEQVAVTALLPREKTYNVASITDKNASIGGGVATGVMLGGSIAWGFSHKTYYLVQDQDTVALTRPPSQPDGAAFLWQFRPVLGQHYVRAGLKQTFVQLAFPVPSDAECFGTVRVRSYWRKYDRKKNLVLGLVKGSLNDYTTPWPVPRIELPLDPKGFSIRDLEDLGNGNMLVTLQGRFLTGTSVRIGGTFLSAGTSGFTYDLSRVRFVASINDLATKQVAVVGRDGSERPLLLDDSFKSSKGKPQILRDSVSSLDASNSLLKLELTDVSNVHKTIPLLIVIGGQAFGYSDAPIERSPIQNSATTITAIVPTALLAAHRKVIVTPLLAEDDYRAEWPLTNFDPASQSERLVLLEKGAKSFKFLLYGSRLSGASVVFPENVTLKPIGRPQDLPTLQLLELTAAQVKDDKQVLLQRPNERPVPVSIPSIASGDSKSSTATHSPMIKERVTVGSDEAIMVGDDLDELQKVSFRGKEIHFEKQEGAKSLRLTGLKAAGVTSEAATQTLDLTLKDGKATVNLEVVSEKVETVPK